MPQNENGEEVVATGPQPVAEAGGVGEQITMFFKGYRMTGGDWGSLTQLFFDNLSTLLGAVYAIQDMKNFGVPMEDISNVVWGRLVPGVGVTIALGNIFYTYQAIRLTKVWGRPYTAQPYGLNTPAAFAFVYNIMYPVYFQNVDLVGPSEAFAMAYQVALSANFITGLICTFLAFFGPYILKVVPPAALLVPIAGIGITFLGLEQVSNCLAAPIVGYNAIMWVFLGWYSGVRLGFGNWRLPEALQVILVGTILGWITGINTGQQVKDASSLVKWYGPAWTGADLFAEFDLIGNYLGIVIPIGISAAATTLMCLVSAKGAGDPFPVRESMIADGLGTLLATFFGSPFGTVIYIGHPAHKKSGALVGYSLTNGLIYLFLSWFGVLALMQSITNQATIGPIVLFVGLAVNEETLTLIPARHYAAYVIGLFPSVFDWVVNISGMSPIQDFETGGNEKLTGLGSWFGVLAWKRGSLLVSFVWVGILVQVIDRHWYLAAVWGSIGCFFALFGIIHMPEAGFKSFSEPVWEQCKSSDDCWPYGEQWMFFLAYVMLTVTFVMIGAARQFGLDDTLKPRHEEANDEAQAFSDWFADAATDTRKKHAYEEYDEAEELAEHSKSRQKTLVDSEEGDKVDELDSPEMMNEISA